MDQVTTRELDESNTIDALQHSLALVQRNRDSEISLQLVSGSSKDAGSAAGLTLPQSSNQVAAIAQALPKVRPVQSLRILSLDGGGVKGYTALLILQRIFRTFKVYGGLDDNTIVKPCQVFDLIVGTSTGGLIATMLGCLELSIEDALKQYEIVGKDVFGKPSLFSPVGKLARAVVARPFFDIKRLQTGIKTLLKDEGIKEDEVFCSSSSPTCKVMLCVTNKQTSKPDVFRNYKTSHATQEDYKCTIWEATSATAAAPVYFKRVKLQSDGTEWVDGGFSPNRNNPIHEAIAELERDSSFNQKEIGCLVSIGTGAPAIKNISAHVVPIMQAAVKMLTDSENIANEFAKTRTCVDLQSSSRYFRFNVPQGMEAINLADYREISTMKALTDNYLRNVNTGRDVQRCAEILFNPDENIEYEDTVQNSILPDSNVLHFVEREYYLIRLRKFFQHATGESQRFVLHGMGGIGKTQIALSFAHECKEKVKIFWISAENYSSFTKDYIQIYSKLEARATKAISILEEDVLLKRTKTALEKHSNAWILILDNADNIDTFLSSGDYSSAIGRHLPNTGRILLTTRDSRFVGSFARTDDCERVDGMNEDEAKDLLLRSIPHNLIDNKLQPSIDELIEELGHLPLGIAQAAVNIRDLAVSVEAYLRLFRDKRQQMDLLLEPFQDIQSSNDRNRKQSVLVTWELSFQYLADHHSMSMLLLEYCSIFHWRDIATPVLHMLPEYREMKEIQFKRTVARLSQSSLILMSSDSEHLAFDIHPLIHSRIFDRMDEARSRERTEEVIAIFAIIFPIHLPRNPRGNPGDIKRIQSRLLLPHAAQIIQHGNDAEIISTAIARLIQNVASYFSIIGRHDSALSFVIHAYELAKMVWPLGDKSIHFVHKVVIGCYCENQDYVEALIHINQAYMTHDSERLRQQYNDEELDADLLTLLGYQLQALYHVDSVAFDGKVDESVQIALEPGKVRWVADIHNFASWLNKQGCHDDAYKLEEKCCGVYEQLEEQGLSEEALLHYTYSLNTMAAARLRNIPDDSTVQEKLNIQSGVLGLYQRSYDITYRLWRKSPTNMVRDLLYAASNITSTARAMKSIESGIQILETTLSVVMEQTRIEGTEDYLLYTIGQISTEVLNCMTDVDIIRKTSLRCRIDKVFSLLAQWLLASELELYDAIRDPVTLNNHAVHLLKIGQPQKCIDHCLRALAIDPDVLYIQDRDTWNVLHYNIMIAMSRQTEQETKAWSYRQVFWEEIEPWEVKRGMLAVRLDKFRAEKKLYEEAQSLRDQGLLKYKDQWWNEHAPDLAAPEVFYGLLFEEG